MRISWVTPFSSRSAIGRVSASVCEKLDDLGHDVTVVTSDYDRLDPGQLLATRLPIVSWQDLIRQGVANTADVTVVNIGDNYQFHAGALHFLERESCLGIIHDFYLYNLFQGWLSTQTGSVKLHDRIIATHYGPALLPLAQQAREALLPLAEVAKHLPMTEWIAAQCGGAIIHANFYRERVKKVGGPLRVIPLCQRPRHVEALSKRDTKSEVVILTTGVMNPNKRADLVIEAIGLSPRLRSRCRYRLAGRIGADEQARLRALAGELKLKQIDILGEVTEAQLEVELERSDIISCLRSPVLEGASASAIEAMMAGRPVVVTDAGFYRELPDALVRKVPENVTREQLAYVLEELVADETMRRSIGADVSRWARQEFSTERYIAELLPVLDEFVFCKPILECTRSIGRDLALLAIRPEDIGVDRIARSLQQLLAPDDATNCPRTTV